MAPRRKDDAYITPDPLALAICKRVERAFDSGNAGRAPAPARIVDAGAGEGAFCRAARAVWPAAKIVAVDSREVDASGTNLLSAVCVAAGADKFFNYNFLDLPPAALETADLVIGNPPYSLAEEFVAHAWKALKPGAAICFLLGNSFRGSTRRWSPNGLFAFAPFFDSWPIVPRPSFTADGKMERTEYEAILWIVGQGAGRVEPVRWEK